MLKENNSSQRRLERRVCQNGFQSCLFEISVNNAFTEEKKRSADVYFFRTSFINGMLLRKEYVYISKLSN